MFCGVGCRGLLACVSVPSRSVPLSPCRPPSLVLPAVSPSPSSAHAVASVWSSLLCPGSSSGSQGVLVGCRVFLAATCVGVAPSSRLGVPSLPCAGPGDRWARPGAIRAASGPGCGGASWWTCASGGCAVSTLWGDAALLVLPVWCVPPCCASLRPPVCPLPPVPRLLVLPSLGFPVFPCPCVALPPLPCPCGRLPATLRVSLPPCCGPSLCPFPSRCAGGGLRQPAEGFGGVGGAGSLDRVPEEGFSCRLQHGGLQGGLVGADSVRVGSLRRCGSCAPRHDFPLSWPTSTSRWGREKRTWDGGGACGGTRWSRSGGGGGGGWGRVSAVRGAGSVVPFVGGGGRGCTQLSGNGRGGALGVHGGASVRGSGQSERMWRGGAAGSVSVSGESVPPEGSGSAAVCGIGPRRGVSHASQDVLVGTRGPRVVPPGTGGGKKSPTLHGSDA